MRASPSSSPRTTWKKTEKSVRDIGIIDHGRIVKNTSMRELLKQLHVETFLLDLKESRLVAAGAG
ncbi:ABC transporter ATP-binding protein OS=Stutzerimonas stutzeri OX=316 GN=CXK94_21595 PE=4 SV=1 [Stutzerimonas stutzeri]